MMRLIVKIINIALLFFTLIAGIVVFLLSTTPGLQTVINLCQAYLPGTIKIQQVKGSLLYDFTLEGLSYQHNDISIKINQVNVQWHPNALKNHALSVQWHDLQGEFSKEQKINSTSGTLTSTVTMPELALNLNSKLALSADEHWQMKASVSGTLPWLWTLDASLIQSNLPAKTNGLHTNITLRAITKTPQQGNLVLTIHPGYYQAPDNTSIPKLEFKGGSINVALSPEKLSGTGKLTIDPHKNLNLEFQLPKFALDQRIRATQPVNGALILEINSLDFLQSLSPEINKLKGQLVASLKAKGTFSKPQIESSVILSKTSFELPKLGLNIGTAELSILGKEKHWEANGSITAANHALALKGAGTLDTNYVGDISLEGKDFPVINTSEYQVNASPQLKFHITPKAQTISGSILIPNAQIKPQAFNNSISLPDEVIYKKAVSQEQSSTPALDTAMDITIGMGEQVEVNVKGLKGHLDGTLNIKQQPQGAINAFGELSVRDGTYKAYGQDLAIKQGQLIFTGGPINNPGIRVRAAKKINNTSTYTNATQLLDFNSGNLQNADLGESITVGVEVTGRLTKPTVQLYSDPAILSQADILSMLVLGRPASQANKAGGQLLLTAISSMNVGGTNSTQLLEQLKQTSGLDFNVQTNTNYNQLTNTVTDSTAFVVGKSLSKRLYLSYNIGLSQTDPNVLTLKYMLNKFFSIQISNNDTSSAIDFLYTSNKKNTEKHEKH